MNTITTNMVKLILFYAFEMSEFDTYDEIKIHYQKIKKFNIRMIKYD